MRNGVAGKRHFRIFPLHKQAGGTKRLRGCAEEIKLPARKARRFAHLMPYLERIADLFAFITSI